MSKTRAEVAQEIEDAVVKANEEFAADQKKDAEKARHDAPDEAETEEEYYARINAAASTGIFGDIDTAIETPVVSSNNEEATVAVAEKDASGSDASDDEARRQVDVAAGTVPSAEEVNAEAPKEDTANTADEKKEDKPLTPAQKAAATRKANA